MVLDDEGGAAATTAGAGLVQTNVYLTAAAVMICTTRALWLKLRNMMAAEDSLSKDQETASTIDGDEDERLKDCGFPMDLNTS